MSVMHHTRRASLFALGTLVVLCLGLISSVAPAKASDDRFAQILLGTATGAILAQSSSRQVQSHPPPRAGRGGLPQHCRETVRTRGGPVDVFDAQCLRAARIQHLPQACRETLRTHRGHRTVYRASCLRHAYQPAPQRWHLPRECRVRYDYKRQLHPGYLTHCLHQRGVRHLPEACQVRGFGGRVYSEACLRSSGVRHW